jgi:hypothetical protein
MGVQTLETDPILFWNKIDFQNILQKYIIQNFYINSNDLDLKITTTLQIIFRVFIVEISNFRLKLWQSILFQKIQI